MIRNLHFSAFCSAALLALWLGTNTAFGASPQPWQWTPAKAAEKATVGLGVKVTSGGRYSPVVCRGLGRSTGGRFTSFACSYTYRKGAFGTPAETFRAWLKTRPSGAGGGCLSRTPTIPAACLRATASVGRPNADPVSDVRVALQEKLNPGSGGMYQGPIEYDCVGVDGWYGCTFNGGPGLSATVVYTKAGVTVKLL